MKTRQLFFGGLLFVFLFTGIPLTGIGEVLVITHNSVPVESLKSDTISEIYMGTRTKWDDETKIRVAMLKKGETHEAFVQDIVKTTPAKLKNLWKKVVFTGAGTPPKILKKEEDLVEFVAETEGAIGYIDSSTPHEEVKVISVEIAERKWNDLLK